MSNDQSDESSDGGGDGGSGDAWDGITSEQRAVVDVVLELAEVSRRFRGLSESIRAASGDRDNFAREYLSICEVIHDLRINLDELDTKLRERALAAMKGTP